jgi:hypothetical protein
LLRIIREDPVPPPSPWSDQIAGVRGFDELILRALAKHPAERYRDAIARWLRRAPLASRLTGWFKNKRGSG